MFFLNQGITFVRFLLFFIIGIAIGMIYKVTIDLTIPISLLIGYSVIHFYGKQTYSVSLLKSVIAWTVLFSFGILLVCIRTETGRQEHYIHRLDSIQSYKATVISAPEKTPKTTRVILEVNHIRTDSSIWRNASGKIIGYVSGKEVTTIKKGDVWLIRGTPTLPPAPSNPGQFNYASYLERQNIRAIHFLKENHFVRIGHTKQACWRIWSDRFRAFCEEELRKGIKGDNEYYLTVALLLGGRAGLDEKLYQAYSETGTVHALAVSGLHVSLIYFIVIFLFGYLKRIKYGKYLFTIVSILVFWFYAMVTGFSPSVVRAVTMFSVFLIAGILKRNSGIYNTLAFSAFIILCVEPFWLMDIGFQFSFLAVVGIAYLYPIIYGWWECKNFILDKLWSLIGLSIAAQLAVAPLSIYYFHSFPLLFLPFNMLIVPISSLALYTGLTGLILVKIPFLSDICMWATEYLVKLMNYLVQVPSGSKFLKMDFLFLSVPELIFCYLFLILFFFSLKSRIYISFVWAVAFLFLFTSSVLINSILSFRHKVFTVYNVKNKTVLAFIHKGNAIILSDSTLTKNDKDFRFNIYNHLSEERIGELSFYSFYETDPIIKKNLPYGQLIIWNGKKILRITEDPGELIQPELYHQIDYLIVSNRTFYKTILNSDLPMESGKILIDPTIKEKSSRMREDFYYINKMGAFVWKE